MLSSQSSILVNSYNTYSTGRLLRCQNGDIFDVYKSDFQLE